MAISPATFANGDTDYVSKLNANFTEIETAINTAEATNESLANKGQPSGYAPLGADSKVPEAYLPDLSRYQLRDEKGVAGGYASLDVDGKVPAEQLPEPQDMANYIPRSLMGVSNGIATLNSSGDVPTTQIPDLSATYIPTAQKGANNGVCPLGAGGLVDSSDLPDLSATYVPTAQKGAANGVAELDADGLVPADQLPDIGGLMPAQPYDMLAFYPGKPADAAVMTRLIIPRAVVVPQNATGSYASAITASSSTATLTIKKNGVSIGTITFTTSATGSFTFSSEQSFAAGDVLTVENQATADATLADVSITLIGTR